MSSTSGSRLKPAAVFLLALAAWSQAPAVADTSAGARSLATLDEVAAAARANSLDYARARNAAVQAAQSVPDLIKLKSATLSAGYSYTDTGAGAASAKGGAASPSSVSVSANVPIIDQIGLSAQLDQSLSSSVSASLSPLAHSDARTQALLSYQKAAASAEEAGRTAAVKAIKAALAWMSASRQVATAERAAAASQEAYEAAKAGNAIDPKSVTIDDLVSAMQAWSDSRSALARAQSSARNTEAALYAALGTAKGETGVAVLDSQALAQALSALEARLAGVQGSGPAASNALKGATIDVAAAESKLKATWLFEPDLSITGGFSIPSSGAVVPSASVKLTLSLDDLKGDQVKQAAAALDLARRSLALQKSQDANAFEQAVAAADSAKINTESRLTARDQAVELVKTVQLNLKAGDASALDAENAALTLAQAEDAYFQALADEYSAWLDLGASAGK